MEFTYGHVTMEINQIAGRGEAVWEATAVNAAKGFEWAHGYGKDYREAAIDLLRLHQQIRLHLAV